MLWKQLSIQSSLLQVSSSPRCKMGSEKVFNPEKFTNCEFYCSEVDSQSVSSEQQYLLEICIKVYCIMWFTIRSKSSCSEGARHLWQAIRSTRYLNDALKAIVDPVISRNAYYARPENLFLAMISDDRPYIRTLGLRRIMKARSMTPSENETTIRKFLVSELNFNANDYSEIIDWQKCLLTEPPIAVEISDETLEKMILKGEVPELNKFPCHTQAVEFKICKNSNRGLGCCAWCWEQRRIRSFGQDLLLAEKCLRSTVNAIIMHKQNNLNLMMSNFMWKLRTF